MDGSKYSQHVSAFKLNVRIILITNSKTEQGLWYLHKPIVVVDAQLPAKDLGVAVFQTLSQAETAFSKPPGQTELEATMNNLYQAASVHSFEELLQQHTRHCSMGRHTAGIEITPTHNGGAQGETKGFHFLPEKRILVDSDISPKGLGQALGQGFEVCTFDGGESELK